MQLSDGTASAILFLTTPSNEQHKRSLDLVYDHLNSCMKELVSKLIESKDNNESNVLRGRILQLREMQGLRHRSEKLIRGNK